jgi:tRNA A-37 threonylcarbamoyl transferase component Bud32
VNTRRWERVSDLLARAVDLDAHSRAAMFAEECADDPSLGEEVERLVAADSRVRGFLEPLPVQPTQAPVAEGARIGGYTLIRRIAAGGMGVVFEARQERPNRRVAIKLVQSALVDASTLRRFQFEAEALGRLRHAGIAQVYEAGVDVDSNGEERPFLAMELVEGARPLTSYARERALSFAECAGLFRGVCAAVQHGHDRGVLHRDLKSSNVLVDANGAPKLIDFGIAKVLGDEHTRATLAGELVGTLSSMSPEQLDGDLDALDVRSDVYALGALLYELLCGIPPIDLRGMSLSEALTKARTTTPKQPTSVRADLPVELEWILLRALEPDRRRRYASAAELASDIDRFLGDEPVWASPPSTVYRVRKFVLRNRVVVGAACAILTTIVAGALVALVQRDRAVEARVRAEDAESLARGRLEQIEAEARTNRELATFQAQILTSADPDGAGRDVRVVDALARATDALDARAGLDPKLELALRRSIFDAYAALGAPREAASEIQKMRPLWESLYELDDAPRLELERLALDAESFEGSGEDQRRRAHEGLERATRRLGLESDETAGWMLTTANCELARGDVEAARALASRALADLDSRTGSTSELSLRARDVVGRVLDDSRSFVEAEAWRKETFENCSAEFGEDHESTLYAKKQWALAMGQNERFEEATVLLREVVDSHDRRGGARSSRAFAARLDLADFLCRTNRPTDSVALAETVLQEVRAEYGEESELSYIARIRRAQALRASGRAAEAIDDLTNAVASARGGIRATDPLVMELEHYLAQTLYLSGRLEEAAEVAGALWRKQAARFGEQDAGTLTSCGLYAAALAGCNRLEQSIQILEGLLDAQDARYGPLHRDCLYTLANLATAQLNAEDLDGASCTAQELIRRIDADPDPRPSARASAHWSYARVLDERGEHSRALEHHAMAACAWDGCGMGDSNLAIYGMLDEAYALGKLGRRAEERAVRERAVAATIRSEQSPQLRARVFSSLAWCVQNDGEPEYARELARMVLADAGPIEPNVRRMTERIAGPD